MNKYFAIFCIFFGSLTVFAGEITDPTCEIGVIHYESVFMTYTMSDKALQVLVESGYGPYQANGSAGLYLYWDSSTETHWYGETTIYKVSVKRKSDKGDILLGAAQSTSSYFDALRALPRCITR